MTIQPEQYTVRIISLPYKVPGLVAMDEEGHYNIYLNACLNREGQKEALRHELEHIAGDDFYNSRSILDIERR